MLTTRNSLLHSAVNFFILENITTPFLQGIQVDEDSLLHRIFSDGVFDSLTEIQLSVLASKDVKILNEVGKGLDSFKVDYTKLKEYRLYWYQMWFDLLVEEPSIESFRLIGLYKSLLSKHGIHIVVYPYSVDEFNATIRVFNGKMLSIYQIRDSMTLPKKVDDTLFNWLIDLEILGIKKALKEHLKTEGIKTNGK